MADSHFPDDDRWLTHYADRRNLEAIRETRALQCAWSLMDAGERKRYATEKRGESLGLANMAVLRDQQPLSERIVFCDGAKLPDYIEYLNEHVFFWPDSSEGERYRGNFRAKYPHPAHIGLRCKLGDLRAANPCVEILFSPVNSGATPLGNPAQSPRCLCLFRPLEKRKGKPLVEVVMRTKICLPDNTEEECADGQWQAFFCADTARPGSRVMTKKALIKMIAAIIVLCGVTVAAIKLF